jgi:hypothetical protein
MEFILNMASDSDHNDTDNTDSSDDEEEEEKEEEKKDDDQDEEEKQDDTDDDDDSERPNLRTFIDWTRGRCMRCLRQGQLGRRCRYPHQNGDHFYSEFMGVCDGCESLGHVSSICSGPYCVDAQQPHIPYRPQRPLDPDEEEESTADDADFDAVREHYDHSDTTVEEASSVADSNINDDDDDDDAVADTDDHDDDLDEDYQP